MNVFCVMPSALFTSFLAPRDNQGRQNRRHQTQRAWGHHQGPTKGTHRRKGGRGRGGKRRIPVMKLTVDIQQCLRKENGKAVTIPLTDLKIDKTKERGQI